MSGKGAQEIAFRSAIGACNSGSDLRVYMQDVMGNIRESVYDGSWSNGTEKNTIASAKLGSPIAVASKELKNIRVYYLSTDNMMKEAAYDHSKGWYEGAMNKSRMMVAPYSKIAACFLEGSDMTMRVYCQMTDNTIQEMGWNGDNSGWKKMQNLGAAMPGSEIACTSFKTSEMGTRVYFQDTHNGMVEMCYDHNNGWYNGALKMAHMLPRAAMACTSFMMSSNTLAIRLFYATPTQVREMVWDGKKWHDGNFHVDCIPGTEIAAISWGHGNNLNMRVYFQKGELVSGVSEWMWSQGNWKAGKLAIPPA
ncbi:hypothetical protein NUU61_006877 [Penicillium alfredii]|uniref:Fucose-specific lectin n=1 Tax=Penicillium alfredii TaxID=1506179 RepID=A0A9W9F1Q5_9EURO|nr:uncharacterized protein NUU61_006877 [Penicillium alfredii]KAJ5092007.1 hypothetical protein NUU61_006877 [Penicillium alfredii]